MYNISLAAVNLMVTHTDEFHSQIAITENKLDTNCILNMKFCFTNLRFTANKLVN